MESGGKSKKKKEKRSFDMSKYRRRHVALKFAYLGWDYLGFAAQDDTERTVEHHVFNALEKTCLISDRASSKYQRCGRTDKGVSALCQVISLYVRSNLTEADGMDTDDEYEPGPPPAKPKEELDYVKMLNANLPKDIRVMGWAPVRKHFNARFSCLHRTYKYFFMKGSKNIDRMKEACAHFVGRHDFRNFCKMDVEHVMTFERVILSFDIVKSEGLGLHSDPAFDMYEFRICGYAFLWHQVRCMVAVLFMVGEGKESPDIIRDMLDLSVTPLKPKYEMAPELPLVLYDCGYEGVKFSSPEGNVKFVQAEAKSFMGQYFVKTAIYSNFCDVLDDAPTAGSSVVRKPPRDHIPLKKRDKEPSYESRLKSSSKPGVKRKREQYEQEHGRKV